MANSMNVKRFKLSAFFVTILENICLFPYTNFASFHKFHDSLFSRNV